MISNAKIYKVTCDETELVYFGSTKKSLKNRLRNHKQSSNTCNTKYMTNPKIELLEYFASISKKDLLDRERYYIEENLDNKNCINKTIPNRTKQEYMKYYFEKNSEQIRKWKTEKHTCECGGKYTNNHKAQHLKSKKHINYFSS